MLTDKEVLPTIYYWAKRLYTGDAAKRLTFDELVNEAYKAAKTLRSPLLLQKWVKYTMLHFIHFVTPVGSQLDGLEVEDRTFDFKEFKETQEELMSVVDKVCSEEGKKLLYLLFWRGLTYAEAAKEMGLSSRQVVSERFKVIRKKMEREYGNRAGV